MHTHLCPPAIAAARTIGRRLSRNRAEREDLASAALLGLLEHAHRHALNADEVLKEPHWRVLQSRAMDRVRRQQRQRRGCHLLAETLHEPRILTAPLRDRIDCKRAIERAESGLKEGERIILNRVFFGDENLTEVAREQGWSHSTARRRRKTLLRELRAGVTTSAQMAHTATQPIGLIYTTLEATGQ